MIGLESLGSQPPTEYHRQPQSEHSLSLCLFSACTADDREFTAVDLFGVFYGLRFSHSSRIHLGAEEFVADDSSGGCDRF